VRPDYDGLIVDPCIPDTLKDFTITRKFRGQTYNIHVSNPNGSQYGVKKLTVNGTVVEGNLIPLGSNGDVVTVEVEM
jgi:cellobiose phosphorylase